MINSAVIVFIITPFTATLTAELIDQVYTILFADMVTSPLVRLLDVGGVFGKYILAPRAKTQEGMNSYFMGTPYTIAERYTDITKTVFLAFFYASIYPAAYFFCFASLIINFFVDKYCLLRVWRQKGRVTKSIGKAARFFMVLSLCAHVVMSSYWWSGFPYDNLCASTGSNDDAAASSPYEFCNQDLLRLNKFPAIPAFGDEWMSTQQRTITAILGWFSVAIVGEHGFRRFRRFRRCRRFWVWKHFAHPSLPPHPTKHTTSASAKQSHRLHFLRSKGPLLRLHP